MIRRFLATLGLGFSLLTPVTPWAADSPTHSLLAARNADVVPRYLLADPQGRSVTSEDFRGKFQLITFGYTYCPDVCPTTLAEMADILKRLGEKSHRLQAIFITVDPERDSGEHLKTYVAFFDPRILALTGSPALISRAADNFRVRYAKVRDANSTPERYAVDHSAGMYLIAPDGTFLKKFGYATPTADMAASIEKAMAR